MGVREGPGSCWEKRLGGLNAISEIGSDWVACFSDDNYVFVDNLYACLSRLDPNEPLLVGGHSGTYRIKEDEITYPSGGAGYCLSRGAIRNIPLIGRCALEWERSGGPKFEDVFIGGIAKSFGIRYIETPGFYGCNPLTTTDCHPGVDLASKPISLHYVNERQMLDLHKMRYRYV